MLQRSSVATDMPTFALRNLKVSFRHVFACDVEPACRRLIAQVGKRDRLYDDIATRPFSKSDTADLHMCTCGAVWVCVGWGRKGGSLPATPYRV